MSGATTRKEIIEDDAIIWGKEYANYVQQAVEKNKEFVASILAMNEANKSLKSSNNTKELTENQKNYNTVSEKSLLIWKEQNQLEIALISTKRKNELATESTNRALIKERITLAETNKELKLQGREQLGLVGTYERLNRSRNEAQKRLAELLSAEKKNVAEIIIAQREYDKLDVRVKAVDAATRNYSKNIGNYSSAFNGLNESARSLISTFGLLTGVALFGAVVKDIFSVIRDFDKQLIAVGKTTNITGVNLKEFGREVVNLGDQLDGISVEGLLKSSEVAGQLGVKGTENILKFSTAIEKLKLTSDIISEEQVQNFAKFIEVSSDSFENADKLASVITQLGNNFATTESQVLSNATEIQKGVAVYETTAQSILGIGAATSALGSEAESSRSAIQTTFKVINDAIVTGANLEKVLKLTGLTQKELSAQFNKDAGGVFQKFVKGLADAKGEGENLSRVLNDIGITEKRAFTVVGSLAANYGVLESAIAQANEEYINNSALNKEVAAASESIASIVADLNDKWQAYILRLNDSSGASLSLAKVLKFLRDNFKEIIDFVIKFGTVFITYIGVIKAYNFVIAASTALQTAWVAGQIRFALSTGIGTTSILAQAEAAKAATIAQNGLNIATKATPWGFILGLISALVVAYVIFNKSLSETERIQKNINDALAEQKLRADESKKANEEFLASQLKGVEDQFKLLKAGKSNTEQLDKAEIESKKKVLKNNLEVNNLQILANTNLLNEVRKNSVDKIKILEDETVKLRAIAENSPLFGRKERADAADQELKNLKTRSKISQNALIVDNNKYIDLNKDLQSKLDELGKESTIKDLEAQAEADKKAIENRKKRNKELFELEKKRADDEFKLTQFRLQVAIDLDKEISDNETGKVDSRINALLEGQQLYETKIKEAAIRELEILGKYNEEKGVFIRELSNLQISEIIRTGETSKKLTAEQQLIFESYQNNLTNATKKGEEARQKIIDDQVAQIQKSIDLETQSIDTELNNRLTAENLKYQKSLGFAKDNYELLEAAALEHERKLLKITEDYAKEKLQVQIDAIQNLLDNNALLPASEQISAEKRAEIENNLSKYKSDLSQLNVETVVGANEKIIESEKERQQKTEDLLKENSERIRQLAESLASSLIELTNTIFSAKISNIDAEIEAINNSYDEQIDAAGNDARQKKLLEEEKLKKTKQLEKERQKELVKAAIFNKVIALAQIGMDLAKTLVAINLAGAQLDAISFGTAGIPYRSIQIPLAIGLAAAQTATVLLTPLPKYKDGTKNHKGGPALVGEVRPEVIREPGMDPYIIDRPTILDLKKGTEVIPSLDAYDKLMRASVMASLDKESNRLSEYQTLLSFNDRYSKEIFEELKRNTNAVKKQKQFRNISQKQIDLNYEFWKQANIKWHN